MTGVSNQLSPKGRKLLEAIVAYVRANRTDPARPSTYPNYEVLYRAIVPNTPKKILHVGSHLRRQGLDDLNGWTEVNPGIPKVTGLIVDKNKKRPGKGFFPSHGKTPGRDDRWWHDEARKAIAFDWTPYIRRSRFTFAEVLDVTNVSEGARGTRTIATRQRSAKLRAAAIAYYKSEGDGKLKCYVTNWSAPNIPLKGDIVEMHHLKSLSKHPNKGVSLPLEDAIKLLRPVCPNVHRMLHAKPGGGSYSIDELTTLLKKKQIH
jgi:hypothetical protein